MQHLASLLAASFRASGVVPQVRIGSFGASSSAGYPTPVDFEQWLAQNPGIVQSYSRSLGKTIRSKAKRHPAFHESDSAASADSSTFPKLRSLVAAVEQTAAPHAAPLPPRPAAPISPPVSAPGASGGADTAGDALLDDVLDRVFEGLD